MKSGPREVHVHLRGAEAEALLRLRRKGETLSGLVGRLAREALQQTAGEGAGNTPSIPGDLERRLERIEARLEVLDRLEARLEALVRSGVPLQVEKPPAAKDRDPRVDSFLDAMAGWLEAGG